MLFGALFIEFVPNYADQLTVYFGESAKALPGAVYGAAADPDDGRGADGRRGRGSGGCAALALALGSANVE